MAIRNYLRQEMNATYSMWGKVKFGVALLRKVTLPQLELSGINFLLELVAYCHTTIDYCTVI